MNRTWNHAARRVGVRKARPLRRRRATGHWLPAALCAAAAILAFGFVLAAPARAADAPALDTFIVEADTGARRAAFDGVVEAVTQTVVAAQVTGAVVALPVKAGDRVAAGQLLARIDARAAEQNTASSDAQVRAARSALTAAASELARQKQLFEKHYISQAALERAQANFESAQANAAAQIAQAGATRTQSGFFGVRAPYAGVVAEVAVALGDMATPGRPLVTIYDPRALRVVAAVPQSVASGWSDGAGVKVELPGLAAGRQWLEPVRATLLPTADAGTHTVPLRLDLAPGAEATPGMFARAWLPLPEARVGRVLVPASAVVRRAELDAVYVIGLEGRPLLRLVRLGRADGDRVEILTGLAPGERVAREAQAAARLP
jgi:RND family efflux transporter MFP subunit